MSASDERLLTKAELAALIPLLLEDRLIVTITVRRKPGDDLLEELRERYRQLKQALCPKLEVPDEFGLTPFENKAYRVLAAHKIVTKEMLRRALYDGHWRRDIRRENPQDEPGDNAIQFLLSRLRKKLKPHGLKIKPIRDIGYELSHAVQIDIAADRSHESPLP